MRVKHLFSWSFLLVIAASMTIATGCATDDASDDGENPFLADYVRVGKADTGYLNPDGIEVEVDIEADVEATSWRLNGAPAFLAQYAMTHLRSRRIMYLESLAEDATSKERVEWLVDGTWIAAGEIGSVDSSKLRRFRIRGVNAVLLHDAANGVELGTVFEAPVPVAPYDVMTAAGDSCADHDGHMSLSQSIYWYLWNPTLTGCKLTTQQMTLTISKLFATPPPRYPEYDKLIADGKVTAVVLFGQINDDPLTDSDIGVRGFNRMARDLASAGYEEITPAPVGRRFSKHVGVIDFEIDLYSPRDFAGLSDSSHFGNFEKAVTEHEIVVYDGHSMLGASDFWGRPKYPSTYQIFLYGGCLGYEYYIRPIVDAKGGWDNLDIMSSVVEVSVDANYFAAPVIAQLEKALEGGYDVAWADLLYWVRRKVGDSTFGVSGVSENCFTPTGSRCAAPVDPSGSLRVEYTDPMSIPDNSADGVSAAVEVSESFATTGVLLELQIEHTWVGDLVVAVEHNGVEEVIWDRTGNGATEISGTFALPAFEGADVNGAWNLRVVDTADLDAGTVAHWALVFDR